MPFQHSFFWLPLLILIAACSQAEVVPTPEKKQPVAESEVPELIQVIPTDNETGIARNAGVTMRFSLTMDALSFKVNSIGNDCSGTIQLSHDGFSSCVRLDKPVTNQDKTEILILPAGIYQPQTRYQLKLTSGIKSLQGQPIDEFISSPGFQTVSTQQFGAEGDDRGLAIIADGESNVYIAGQTSMGEESGQIDLFLAKFSASGMQEWIRQSGFKKPVSAAKIVLADSDSIRISGLHNGANSSNIFNSQFNTGGNQEWKFTHELNGIPVGSALAMDSRGTTYSAGTLRKQLKQFLPDGSSGWATSLAKRIFIGAIALDGREHLYAAGSIRTPSTGTSARFREEPFLIKIHRSGLKRWVRKLNATDDAVGKVIVVEEDGVVTVVVKKNKNELGLKR